MTKGRERSAKWYFKNEREVMLDLGLTPTPGSGSSWLNKEDGENDYILAQLKSTDKESYKLTQLDLEKLEYHSMVSNKIPMFVLQFLNKDSRYAIVQIDDIPLLAEYIKTGRVEKVIEAPIINVEDTSNRKPKPPKIGSSKKAREGFYKEKEKVWENKKYKK